MTNLRNRVRSLERAAGGPNAEIWVIEGGQPGEPQFAEAGEHRWDRLAGEPLDAFQGRVRALATQLRLPFVILGGLDLGSAFQSARPYDLRETDVS